MTACRVARGSRVTTTGVAYKAVKGNTRDATGAVYPRGVARIIAALGAAGFTAAEGAKRDALVFGRA